MSEPSSPGIAAVPAASRTEIGPLPGSSAEASGGVKVPAAETAALPGKKLPFLRAAWVVAVLAAGFVLWYGVFRGPADDLGRFQGEWQLHANGREVPVVVRVEGDRWTYRAAGQPARSYRLALKPDARPKQIDLAQLDDDGRPLTFTHGRGRGNEVTLHGVYTVDGGAATVVLAPGVEPRPAALDADAQVLSLTRVTK